MLFRYILHKAIATTATICMLAACSEQCNIAGNSSLGSLDGQMMYLNISVNGTTVANLDSCEVIHGRFAFSPGVDSVVMVKLISKGEYIMPLVLEGGDVNISIDHAGGKISGGVLNKRLNEFMQKRVRLENQRWELDRKCMRMMHEGHTPEEIDKAISPKIKKLIKETEKLETKCIMDNYDNPLGPGLFAWLFGSEPVPVMTSQIQEIIRKAPKTFLNDPNVSTYIRRASFHNQTHSLPY